MAEPGCSGCYWSQSGVSRDRLASESFYNLKPRIRSKIFDSETDLSREPFSQMYYSDDERISSAQLEVGQPSNCAGAGHAPVTHRTRKHKSQPCKASRDNTDRWGLCWQDVRSLPRSGGRKWRQSRDSSCTPSNNSTRYRTRGVLSWLNLMSDTEPKIRKKSKLNLQDEFDSAADIFLGLDQITFADSEPDEGIGNIHELQASNQGRRSDFVDDILECTLVRPKPPVLAGVNPRRGLAVAGGSQQHKGSATTRTRASTSRPLRGDGDEDWYRSMPFIQSVDNKQVLVGRVEPLHLSRAMRRRDHILHCYEFQLMLRLDQDQELWQKLCDRFGYCDECRASKDATSSCASSSHPAAASSGHQAAAASSQAATASTSSSHGNASGGHHTQQIHREIFRGVAMNPDLWFLAVTLKESKDKLIHFIRSEMPRRPSLNTDFARFGAFQHQQSFLSSYLNTFNFVEIRLDSILESGSELSACIYQCRNVKILSLKNNFLQKISPEIGNMAKLEKLFLTHNQLQIKSIPYTLTFCRKLKETFFDNNLFNALPCLLLRISSLQRVHRHGNHNYFKDTFMFYHTDINDRILEVPGANRTNTKMNSLQELAGLSVLRSRQNYFSAVVPTRLKQYLTLLTSEVELCDHCSEVMYSPETHYKVYTFKNPYLGNTCVPFQHTACSAHCAQAIEVPARIQQLMSARQQDSEYQEYVRESLLYLDERQNSVGGLSDSFCSRTSRSSRRSTVTWADTSYSLLSPDLSRSNSNHSVRQSQKTCGIF